MLEDLVTTACNGFKIIHDSMHIDDHNPTMRHPDSDVVRKLFASVTGAIKRTQAEKILSNVEMVALHLAVHINVRSLLLCSILS